MTPKTSSDAPDVVRRICAILDREFERAPTLAEMGRRLGISAHAVLRQFRTALGITPRDYAAARRAGRLRALLRHQAPVASALYDAGYGSSSRLYEHSNAELGMTPATYRRGGRGMEIHYTTVKTPLGHLLVGATDRGICSVKLGDSAGMLEEDLAAEYPAASRVRDLGRLSPAVTALVEFAAGQRRKLDLPVDVQGTAFQRQVWNQLRRIPFGRTASYGDVAAAIGRAGAARAVARACASNHAALVIPCHRVVQGDGRLGGYHWGTERKARLVEMERGAPAAARSRKARRGARRG